MLQILGASCRHLEHLDIWKSTGVTDSGVAMLLGLEAEKPFRVCSTLRKVRPVEGGKGGWHNIKTVWVLTW
jgi:hypothetical protein